MISCLGYRDCDAMIEWLARAFGFEKHAVFHGPDGKAVHAELKFGNGMVMIGPAGKSEFGKAHMLTPDKAGGRCTHVVYVIVEDVDAHHARAKAAGAEIVVAPKDESYGGRNYGARDPEGYVWSFGSYDPWKMPAQS